MSLAAGSIIGDMTSLAFQLALGMPQQNEKVIISELQEELKSLKLLYDRKTSELAKVSLEKADLQSQVYDYCHYHYYYYY